MTKDLINSDHFLISITLVATYPKAVLDTFSACFVAMGVADLKEPGFQLILRD